MNESEKLPQPDDPPSAPWLDYERRNPAPTKRPWRVSIWGIISFSSMVLWLPCMACTLFIGWGYLPQAPGGGPSALAGVICEVAYFLPLTVALATGLYSTKVAGITLRNIWGVIGLIASATILLAILIVSASHFRFR